MFLAEIREDNLSDLVHLALAYEGVRYKLITISIISQNIQLILFVAAHQAVTHWPVLL